MNSIIWNIGMSVIQCKQQNRQYYHREIFTTLKLFTETLIEEMKPIVIGDKRI